MFLLSHLLTRVAFELDASCSFINASCVIGCSVIPLMVDLRVVDIVVVDVILDMDDLTAIALSVIRIVARLSYPTRSWSWVRLHMHVVQCVCAWNFGTKFFIRRGECEIPENSNF